MAIILILLSVLVGCQYDVSKNKEITCKDFRDGETFTYNSNTVKNARWIGFDFCWDFIDSSGRERTACRSHEVYLKCK